MRSRLLSLVIVVAVGVAACGDDDAPSSGSSSTTGRSTTSTAPTSEPPATGAGQPAIRLDRVVDVGGASGLVDLPGDGPVLVSTLEGRILEAELADGRAEEVFEITDLVSTGGERGLLDIAAAPDGQRLFMNFTQTGGDTRIMSVPLVDGRPQLGPDEPVLLLDIDQPRPNHNGGNLEFGPDGALWIGTGDGGGSGDPDDRAQDPADLLGKMLRIVPDAAGLPAPADNPDGGGAPEVWAVGLRNPWRYSFDPETGMLWVADVGQNAVEEVSVIDPASAPADRYPNFGWPAFEGDREFGGGDIADHVAPALTYTHAESGGCSVTGGHVYRGDAVASLVGWYVFGDYCGGWLRAVPADDPGSEPVELAADIGGVISIERLDDGELLVFTTDGIHRLAAA